MRFLFITFALLTYFFIVSDGQSSRPNIVLMVADDMGWDDVSFHGSQQVLTPNIDMLAYTGVALERYYSHCVCTPSRSALLTGKFSHTVGMQGYPLLNGEDRGLPLTHKIMPEHFKDLGYKTHLVGKWHVGIARKAYLPTFRGFDSHFGHRGGYIDYYEYILKENWSKGEVSGFDLWRNMTPAWDVQGYITDVYTEEAKRLIAEHDETNPLFLMVTHNAPHCALDGAALQAPPEVVRQMRHLVSPQRRIYSAMVKKLDDSVGDIVKALHEKGILENTIIVFVSDNGGMTSGNTVNYASNYPLKGTKFTPFEGGIRLNGLIWSKNLTKTNHLWRGYMHSVDWMPTLLSAAGVDPPDNIDGLNLWDSIISNEASKRDTIFEIDDSIGYFAVIEGEYKLVIGKIYGNNTNHQGEDLRGMISEPPSYTEALKGSAVFSVMREMKVPFTLKNTNIRKEIKVECDTSGAKICDPTKVKWCLYNIIKDPCEIEELSDIHPDIAEKLSARLQEELKRILRPRNVVEVTRDPLADPMLYNYTWTTFADLVYS